MSDGEAFSRVKIDAQLSEAGWNLTDGRSVRYEYTLPDGTRRFLAAATGAWRKGDEHQAIRNVWTVCERLLPESARAQES